jgi:hypothetical protein
MLEFCCIGPGLVVLELCPSCWHFCFIDLSYSGWRASVPGFIAPASFLANVEVLSHLPGGEASTDG